MNCKIIRIHPDLKIEALVKELVDAVEKEIILDCPGKSVVLENEINLRLLKFYAEEEDKEITIQTSNRHLAGLAERVGISAVNGEKTVENPPPFILGASVVKSGEVEAAAVPEYHDDHPDLRRRGGILMATAIAFFALVVTVWWFMQPKVVVIVYPKEEELSFRADAEMSTDFTDRQIPEGKIPAKILVKESKITLPFAVTGRKTVGVLAATGKVMFINSSIQSIVVPKGSSLLGQGNVRFLTSEDILVPKKTTKMQQGIPIGEEFGRAETSIVAVQKGLTGNLPAKTITMIEGNLQHALKVINLTPTMNGAEKQVAVVSLDDVKRAEAEALRRMELAASDEVAAMVGKENFYLPELIQTEVIRNHYQPEIGAQSDALTAELEYRAMVMAVPLVEINKYLVYQLSRKTPANFRPINQPVELVSVRAATPKSESAVSLSLAAKGRIRGVLNDGKIRNLIQGKTLAQAKNILTTQEEIANFKIDQKQSGNLPKFAFQIKVVFPEGAEPR